MKTLLVLLAAACLCLVPVVARAGNAHPALCLEMYQYDTDPDDPEFGCVFLGTCPELCYHPHPMFPEEVQCYNSKLADFVGVTPIHVGMLDTPPLAPGWPLPCGPGGGWILVSCGIVRSGAAATFLGMGICPNFLQGPGTPPEAILYTATTQCHDWYDHGAYAKWMTTNVLASFFDITTNADDDVLLLMNCQAGHEVPPQLSIIGGAQWGGTKTIMCPQGPTSVDLTTWGKIKGLYR